MLLDTKELLVDTSLPSLQSLAPPFFTFNHSIIMGSSLYFWLVFKHSLNWYKWGSFCWIGGGGDNKHGDKNWSSYTKNCGLSLGPLFKSQTRCRGCILKVKKYSDVDKFFFSRLVLLFPPCTGNLRIHLHKKAVIFCLILFYIYITKKDFNFQNTAPGPYRNEGEAPPPPPPMLQWDSIQSLRLW